MSVKSSWVAVVLALLGCQPEVTAPVAQRAEQTLWSDARARPQLVSGRFAADGATAEAAARSYLFANAAAFHLDDPSLSLELTVVKKGLAGQYLRFAQRHGRWPVFGGEVVVLVSEQAPWSIFAVNLEHREEAATVTGGGRDIGGARAQELALAAVGATPTAEPQLELGVWVPEQRRGAKGAPVVVHVPALAWRVRASTAAPPHDWEMFVEAASGAVLSTHDRLKFATGSGMVFDDNPVETTGNVTLHDLNDVTSATLDGARFTVPLARLDSSGFLRGSYVDAKPLSGARTQSATNTYMFDRSQSPSFEEVNVYFHVDRVQNRIQTALGITTANNRVQVAVVNAQTADNSFYSPNNSTINYGTGGVDDAEDGDIVMHEYGHSIQDDQVPNFGGGDEGSMGEGFGDYLAGSMGETLRSAAGHTSLIDSACIGDWDSTAYAATNPPCLRRVDGLKHYPEAEAGEVHDDGEMWSAGLWGIRAQLGADVTDKVVLEAHFLLAATASFFTASQALVTADTNVNGGANGAVIRRRMIKQGLSRALTTAPAGSVVVSVPVSIDNPRDGTGNYTSALDDTQTYTVPNATALAVHFTRVDTENDNTCLGSICDNIYLTNGDGDLFQILGGAGRTNVTSSAIAGDTVKIRLVTDPNVNLFGYHVDRIDVLGVVDGGVIDGGQFIDAGTLDAGPGDSGVPDAGVVDSGVPDSGVDSGVPDGGGNDAGNAKTLPAAHNVELGNVFPTKSCGCTTGGGLEVWAALLGLTAFARRIRRRG